MQVISEEEQEKLAALELDMRLPRVAGKFDSWLLIIVLALLCIGLVMVYSASSFVAAHDYGDASYFFQRQFLWVVMGVIVMLVTMHVDYRQWRRFSLIGMLVILPMLVIVLKFGRTAYGASRWLAFGSFFSFQPSELTKLVLALYIADWLARKGNKVGTFLYGLAPFVILVGVVLGLVLLENDMGTAIIIAGFATVMFFTAGANIVQFLLAAACGGLIFVLEAFKGYRYLRLIGFLDPFKHITDINLQLYQSLLALGSGGWFGLGLGASRQKTGYLPFPFTDSIFAILGEELGFIGCSPLSCSSCFWPSVAFASPGVRRISTGHCWQRASQHGWYCRPSLTSELLRIVFPIRAYRSHLLASGVHRWLSRWRLSGSYSISRAISRNRRTRHSHGAV